MNGPLNFTAEALAQEATTLVQKLSAGLHTLPEVDDVHYGATRRVRAAGGKVVLYRFVGEKAPTAKVPLLIVYALVNRPYMVDLQHDQLLVKGLLAQGEDVYVIDWGYPDRSDRFLELDDYINRFIDGAVDHLRDSSGREAVNVLGICQGGALSLCYASLHPEKVKNLITMVTPVDFQTPDNMLLCCWTRELDVDLFVDALGNVPADMMNACYLMLKPFELNLQVRGPDGYPGRQARHRGFPAHGEVDLRLARPGKGKPSAVHQAVLPAQRLHQGRYRDRRRDGGPGFRRHAGTEHLRRAGPPGAAGCVTGVGCGGHGGLHRAELQGRPHRYPTSPAAPSAKCPPRSTTGWRRSVALASSFCKNDVSRDRDPTGSEGRWSQILFGRPAGVGASGQAGRDSRRSCGWSRALPPVAIG